jgi:hypothetical protein
LRGPIFAVYFIGEPIFKNKFVLPTKVFNFVKSLTKKKSIKMTKSITISYSEADESLLMAFFKRLKVKIQPVETEKDYGDKGVPQHVADNIIEGLKLIKQSERGEIKLENAYDLLEELREEAAVTA